MKPIKKVLMLAGVVSAIVMLWLVPNITKAKTSRYVRVYEDTDAKIPYTPFVSQDPLSGEEELTRREVKLLLARYLKDRSESHMDKFTEEAEWFSRATHFMDEQAWAALEKDEAFMKKKYLAEAIDTKQEEFELEPEMFSRATHFDAVEDDPMYAELVRDTIITPDSSAVETIVAKAPAGEKAYIEEVIETEAPVPAVNLAMFSRAIHFKPKVVREPKVVASKKLSKRKLRLLAARSDSTLVKADTVTRAKRLTPKP
ncbi:MAG TPA: hypothetical protein VEB86_05070 [Chryseosolibacter sp.]|nr:hypothetical protein [Chryseosolibacter sp.]